MSVKEAGMHRSTGGFARRDRDLASRAWLSAIVAALVVAGCGRGGVERFDVSGKVTFNGAPVPAGLVIFDPALDEKQDGVEGFAEIHDGRYGTRGQKKGISGGRYRVRIRGFSVPEKEGAAPRKLFDEYQVTVDFPRDSTEHDFEVPASLAVREIEQRFAPP